MQGAPDKKLFTNLDTLDVALGMVAAISVEEKGPATDVVSAVVEHLRAWGRKKVSSASMANEQFVRWAWRYKTPGAKRRSSSVDPRILHHQWDQLRT